MDVEHDHEALMQSALAVTSILYRDSAVVLRDPRIRSFLRPKLVRIVRAIGLPETDEEQILLNSIGRLVWRLREMDCKT